MTNETKITVEAIVEAPLQKVWEAWNNPEDIMKWNAADASWHCPSSVNDLKVGGTFKNRMEAKDGSFGFDFEGVYDTIEPYQLISYSMADGRKVTTWFTDNGSSTTVKTTFDSDTENDPEFQRQGWQAILNNFVNYVESKNINN